VIGTHFNSKSGDQPLFGRFQPPVRVSETQRHAQATIVRDFVAGILAEDPTARVLVLGDINDFQFSRTVEILEEAGLTDLIRTLPENERYSYVFEGNSQALDHILASRSLLAVAEYDVVHVNSEFSDQISDHDPDLAYLALTPGAKER
jgi:predicted extracellular nuclease